MRLHIACVLGNIKPYSHRSTVPSTEHSLRRLSSPGELMTSGKEGRHNGYLHDRQLQPGISQRTM